MDAKLKKVTIGDNVTKIGVSSLCIQSETGGGYDRKRCHLY